MRILPAAILALTLGLALSSWAQTLAPETQGDYYTEPPGPTPQEGFDPLSTITAVHFGMTVMAQGPLEQWHNGDPAELIQELGLSTRDKSILALTCDGLTNAEIGRAIHLSESSVKVQISNLMRKLGVGNRVQLVVRAHGLGLHGPRKE